MENLHLFLAFGTIKMLWKIPASFVWWKPECGFLYTPNPGLLPRKLSDKKMDLGRWNAFQMAGDMLIFGGVYHFTSTSHSSFPAHKAPFFQNTGFTGGVLK